MWAKAASAILFAVVATVAVAQTQSTGNLITNNWTGVSPYTGTGGNTTSHNGNVTGYNSSNNTIYFGYNQGTASQLIGINQALSGTGIQVNGYNWSWEIDNNNYDNRQGSTDTLTATINTLNSSNQAVHTFSQTYNTKFTWTTFSGTQTYANPYLATDLSSLQVQFSGRDVGFWAGYYGPMVRNVNIGLNYTVDQCSVNPQSSPTCPGYKTYYNMWDDGYAQVNLPFAFPFYGQTFTTSYMFTNGVVGFLNTNLWGYCCDGTDLNQQAMNGGTSWNFAIYALNTDLYPGPNSQFYTQRTDNGTGLKYTWENVVEIGTNYENTFSVNIKDTGYIGINYEKVNLSAWRNPLIGIAGDVSQGQYSQYYFGQASGLPNLAGSTLTYTGTETTDICAINPLYNSSCPGYQQAYFNQQCSINSLYDPSCPGYQQAYFTQQCSANALYDPACPGYAQAYYDYQCSADPLYHTGCPGYQQAYFDQQCNADPLYNNQCSGYQQAYFDQQCGLNGLYSTQCPNYADAYYVQQCTISPLYDSGCTGYAQAYFSQQCTLDGLYDKQCPNYAEAYAKKNILNIGSTTPVVEAPVMVAATESSTPQLISDPVANQAVTTTTTSASPAQPVAPVQLVPTPQPVTTAVTEEKKEDSKTENPASDSSATTTASTSENKDQPKSTRQALAERRLAAARAKAVEDGKQMANKMGEAASMEAQIQVQGVVMATMGFTPGFDAYGRATLPDAQGYRPFEIYPGQRVIDNPQGRRFLTGSDRLHAEMVDQQYGENSQ